MRIWSLHPAHLDRMGLVACWRETLLAQAVLAERTRGYRNHPQLVRFRAQPAPLAAVGTYLEGLAAEARRRGYRFDTSRIIERQPIEAVSIAVTSGQLAYEWQHLGNKLRRRSPDDHLRWSAASPTPHPVMAVVPGDIEDWERP